MWNPLLVIVGVVAVGMIGRRVFRVWRDFEIRKQVDREAEQRRMLEVAHRFPRPMSERASQGFEKRNRMVS